MTDSWSTEVWRLLGIVFLGVMAGLIFGQLLIFLLLGVISYLVWHLWQLKKLEHWLREGKKLNLPQAAGIWGEIYHQLYRLHQRNRKRKRKLADILTRFQESTAAMPDATVVLRETGEIEWWNDAATELLGLRSPHDVGQRIDNLLRYPILGQFLADGEFSERVEVPSPVDERIMLSIQVIRYGNNQRLFVARDTTRLHQLEQIRRDFVANVSHELRSPLTVMVGYLETLLDRDSSCRKEWGGSLQVMQQQALRMQHIVDELLLLSRLEGEQKLAHEEEIFVPDLLDAIRQDALALGAEKFQTITTEVNSTLWLYGNVSELRSAFSNLVFNAVQYTPAKGCITISWQSDAAAARLTVTDTGIGIAAHHISRLTERFYRVDSGRSRESGGAGLGLAIVKHVLNRHQAQLQVESEIDKGSSFTCVFPLSRTAVKAFEASA